MAQARWPRPCWGQAETLERRTAAAAVTTRQARLTAVRQLSDSDIGKPLGCPGRGGYLIDMRD